MDYRCRSVSGQLAGEYGPVDFVALCEGLGTHAVRAHSQEDLYRAIEAMKDDTCTTTVVIEVDKEMRVPGYEPWWDVPISEVAEIQSVRAGDSK
jgi:3D-(3,5/4)-trihydroxycyclohexane-1,2-dione acylhydrolase (decyclizing)